MNLEAFMKQNAIAVENVKYIASKRFVEDGKPIEWELKAISADEDSELRKSCTKRVPVPGRKGVFIPELDATLYVHRLCAKCVVFPPLNDAALQDSYGVTEDYLLLRQMLNAGELQDLMTKVNEICGFLTTEDELVEEAKNY